MLLPFPVVFNALYYYAIQIHFFLFISFHLCCFVWSIISGINDDLESQTKAQDNCYATSKHNHFSQLDFFLFSIYRSEYFLLCIWLCPVCMRRRWKRGVGATYNDYSIKHSYRALKWRGGKCPLTIACQIAQHCLCFICISMDIGNICVCTTFRCIHNQFWCFYHVQGWLVNCTRETLLTKYIASLTRTFHNIDNPSKYDFISLEKDILW